MFTFTCNVSLHCIHTKSSKYYIHLQKKKKNCTNFANVYNINQFLCVYNIILHCKCNVYFYIYIYNIKRVNEKSYSICYSSFGLFNFHYFAGHFFFFFWWMHKAIVDLLYYFLVCSIRAISHYNKILTPQIGTIFSQSLRC